MERFFSLNKELGIRGIKMANILRELFSGKDNKTLDVGRILWAMSILSFLGMGFYGIYSDQVIDFLAYGTGLSGLLAAGGAALGFKRQTEPDPKE